MSGSSSESSGDELQEPLREFVDSLGVSDAERALEHLHDLYAEARPVGAGDELGDYRLIRLIGRGGMGVVFEAEQLSVPGRRVAIKLLMELRVGGTRLDRFAREIEVIGRLDHPGIVPILSADLSAPVPYYAMKLLPGESLRESIASPDWNVQDYRRIAQTIRDVALALQVAHDKGVIHRDITPRNIVFDGEGAPVLVDFGLAQDDRSEQSLTLTTDALGTADYMAPEQITSRFGGVDARTDIYALGVTLYQCLSGETPYHATSRHETFEKILEGGALALRRSSPSIPSDLEVITAKAMSRQPSDRYETAQALAADLTAFLEYRPIAARRASPMARVRGWIRRHPLLTSALAAAAATALIALLTMGYWAPRLAADRWLEVAGEAHARRESLLERAAELRARVVELENQRPDLLPLEPRSPSEWSRMVLECKADLGEIERRIASASREWEQALDQALYAASDYSPVRDAYAELAAEKLEELLRRFGAHFEPEEVRLWETRLRETKSDRFRDLLSGVGRLSVDCPQGRARVWLCPAYTEADGRALYRPADHPSSRDLGTTPVLEQEILEGSYLLRLRRPEPDCVETRLPILIRREAVQRDRERSLTVNVYSEGFIGDGWIYVPAGYSLLGPDRRLTWVDDFFIQKHELTRKEMYDQGPKGLELKRLGWEDLLRLEDLAGDGGDRPLAHFQQSFQGLLDGLNHKESQMAEPQFFHRLPHVNEWERAGRGADGRLFPWGDLHDFGFSSNYWSWIDSNHELRLQDSPKQDCSPFGVYDMAGSLSEPCLSPEVVNEIGLGLYYARGGSMGSSKAEELSLISSFRLDAADYRPDVGLRMVKVLLRPPRPGPSLPFRDDFERRPEPGTQLGDGWRALLLSSQTFDLLSLGPARRARILDGHLQLRGYADSFSPRVMAWHPIEVGDAALRIVVRLRLRRESLRDSSRDRGVSLIVFERLEWTQQGCLAFRWMSDGTLHIQDGKSFRQSEAHSGFAFAERSKSCLLELEVRPDRARGRIRGTDGTGEALEIDLPLERIVKAKGIGIVADNYQAVVVEVDELEVTELPD